MNSMGRDGWLRRALAAGRAGTGAARPGNGAPKRPCPRRVRRRWTAAIAVCAAAAAVVLPAAVANAQPSGLTYLSQFGTQGTGPGQFESPAAVAVNTVTGDVYVTDIVNDVVEVFSASGGYESEFGGPGVGNGQFNTPLGIAVDPTSGDVYVLDNGMAGFGGEGGRIQKFSASGTFMLSWAFSSFEANQIAVDSATGDVYATDDSSNDQVVEFDPNGSQLATFGSFGDGDGQFVEPTTIAVDPSSGDTYVVDTTGACRVQKFDSAGNFLFQFGSCGTGDGQFLAGGVGNNTFEIDGPAGMTVDPATGDLYAVDGGNDRVEVFDSAGNYLSEFGTSGTGNGQFSNPFGAALNPGTGELYVVDNNNDRVEILSTGQTSVAVSSSTDPSVFGQSVTFTATVSAAVGLPAPAGTVQFTVDNQDLGGPVTLNSGSATSDSTAELAVGDHAVSATYIPADGSAPISGTLAADQSVQQGATTTSLMSSPNPSLPGETVTYTATVAPTAPAAGTPTGAVSFSDGASVIGACTAQALTGSTATCIVSYPAGGTHQVTANYAGDSNFAGSTSNLVNEVVGTGSPAPLVVAIKPAFGPGAGGTLVGIAGENLCQATAVNFGAAPAASFTVAQVLAPAGVTCSVVAVSPAGTGVVDVTVTSPGGTSAIGPQDQFSYQ